MVRPRWIRMMTSNLTPSAPRPISSAHIQCRAANSYKDPEVLGTILNTTSTRSFLLFDPVGHKNNTLAYCSPFKIKDQCLQKKNMFSGACLKIASTPSSFKGAMVQYDGLISIIHAGQNKLVWAWSAPLVWPYHPPCYE